MAGGSLGQGQFGLWPVSDVPFHVAAQAFSSRQMQSPPQPLVHRPPLPPLCRVGVACDVDEVAVAL
jgi:hypothetical protein